MALMITSKPQGKVRRLLVDSIDPSPFQARSQFDDTEISALAVSILQNGLLQPISVRPAGHGRYQLVAGERRLRACKVAQLKLIPAIITEYADDQAAALGLLENLQRSQLGPFDTARGLKEVIGLWGCTQAEAARRLGLSQPALANKLRLLSLTRQEEAFCTAHDLTERHARAALRLIPPRRLEALEKMAEGQLNARQADALVEQMLKPDRPTRPAPVPMLRDVRIFFNTMQHALEVMVQSGVRAAATRQEGEGYIEYTVRIDTPVKPLMADEGSSPV